ncbi:DUF4178 domain-containing protein [Massilia sp. B-10]|nr:DUF4178 domain-containing protein [Massilia sp. B-10]
MDRIPGLQPALALLLAGRNRRRLVPRDRLADLARDRLIGANSTRLESQTYTKLYDYTATVRHAAGAFNWRVSVGDQVRVSEFESGQTTLAAELTDAELTWSRSTPVAFDQIKTWFGTGVEGAGPANAAKPSSLLSTQMKFVWWILGLNAIPTLFAFGDTFFMTIAALVALFYPASYFQNGEDK